jgi:hypothetical protein
MKRKVTEEERMEVDEEKKDILRWKRRETS